MDESQVDSLSKDVSQLAAWDPESENAPVSDRVSESKANSKAESKEGVESKSWKCSYAQRYEDQKLTRDDFTFLKTLGKGAYAKVSDHPPTCRTLTIPPPPPPYPCGCKHVFLTSYYVQVYLVEHKTDGKKYACKVVDKDLIRRKEKLETLQVEREVTHFTPATRHLLTKS